MRGCVVCCVVSNEQHSRRKYKISTFRAKIIKLRVRGNREKFPPKNFPPFSNQTSGKNILCAAVTMRDIFLPEAVAMRTGLSDAVGAMHEFFLFNTWRPLLILSDVVAMRKFSCLTLDARCYERFVSTDAVATRKFVANALAVRSFL